MILNRRVDANTLKQRSKLMIRLGLFTQAINILSYLLFILLLTTSKPSLAQDASHSEVEEKAKSIKPKRLDDNALLVNSPSLYAPYAYEPKLSTVEDKSDILGTLVKNKSQLKPLKVEISLPSYIYDDVVIRWNSAMVSPIDVGLSPKFDISLTPKVEGKWQWQGTQSIRFSPKPRWRYATQYKVKLKGPMKSLKGQKLGPYFELSRHFSTDRNEVSSINLYEKDSWSSYIEDSSLIRVCLDHKPQEPIPLSKVNLYHLQGRRILKKLALAHAPESEVPKTYYGAYCNYFKILEQIEAFSEYRVEVDKGLSSEEGPLLSEKPYSRSFKSETQLSLDHLRIYRHYIQLRFNHKVPADLVYDNVLLYPDGLDPNTLKPKEQNQQNLLWPKDYKHHEKGRARSVELYHKTSPTQKLAVWIRAENIKRNRYNALKRAQVFNEFWKNKQDPGQEWLLLKVDRPNLGVIDYSFFPSLLSVEQINQPAYDLRYYGVDHLCLRWHVLSPKQLAEYDVVEGVDKKANSILSLPMVGKEKCAHLFDPMYVSKEQKFPLVPYRYALAGEMKDWSFTESISQDVQSAKTQPTPKPPVHLIQPPTFTSASKVFPNCSDQNDPCGIAATLEHNFYKWSNQLPTLKSGSGAQFYLLKQKWHWIPKKEGISQGYRYSGHSTAPNKHHYFQNTSMLQATRYGLISKLSEEGGQVWVWDLASRQAVNQAQLTIYAAGGSKVAEAISNQDGIAKFKFDLEQVKALRKAAKKKRINYYIVANVNEDYAFVSSSRNHRVYDGSAYHYYYYYDDSKYNVARGLVWSDRDIYRPGDNVFVAGNLAEVTMRGVEPLRQAKCVLSFLDLYGNKLKKTEFQSSALGGFTMKLKLDSFASLGTYSVEVNCKSSQDPEVSHSWSHDLRVAEFKRPTFKVDAMASTKALSEQVLNFKSKAQYFYGASLSDRRWHVFVNGTKDHYAPANELRYQREGDPSNTALGVAKLSQFSFGGLDQLDLEHNELESEIKTYFPHFKFHSKLELNGIDSQSGKLDKDGEAQVKFRPVIKGYTPYRISAQWTVRDSDQMSLSAQSLVSVHPSQSYIGLHLLQGNYVPSDQAQQIEVVVVDPLNNQFAVPQDIELSLFQVQWVKIASKDEIGRDEVQNQQKLVKVGTCQLNQVSTPQTCVLKPNQSGKHIWIARSLEAKGKETYSMISTYTYGSYGSWREREGNDLKLRLTTKQPKIGEELGVLIESPFPEAEVWVTVEREKVIYSQRQKVGPSDMIKIPITEEMGPNAWVKVALTQPRVSLPYIKTTANPQSDKNSNGNSRYNRHKDDSDLGQARELYGSEEIQVSLTDAELKVELKPDASEKRPGDLITVQVSLHDKQSQAVSGEVYLWALDESVARLTNFKAPDIFKALHNDRQNQVKTYSHLTKLIAHATMGNKGYPVGGGGGGDSPASIKSRSDFKATPFFLGVQKVGENGQASFTQKLSDDLTTFKLFALAVSERKVSQELNDPSQPASSASTHYLLRAGVGESKVSVNLPLMLKAVLPRSLIVGDRFNASAMVSSLLSSDEALKLKFELDGPVEALAKTEIGFTVPSQKNTLVSVPYRALALGEVKVKLTLYRNGQVEDRVEHGLEVKAPAAPEHFAQVGEILAQPKGQEETAVIDLRPSAQEPSSEGLDAIKVPSLPAEVQLDFGVSVINNLFNDVTALIEYPYGCLEQRSSRILPFALAKVLKLPVEETLIDSNLDVPSNERIESVVQDYFSAVFEMQKRSGGIRYWMNDRAQINLWSNIYAFVVINELIKIGHKNSLVDIKKLLKFLKKSRPHGFKLKNRREYNVRPEISAFLSFALSEYAEADHALEENLYSIKDQLNLNAKLLLAASMAGPIAKRSQGARLKAAQDLFKEAMRSFKFDGERLQLNERKGEWAWWSFDSNRRKLALALIAMLRVEPDNELVLPLLKTLSQKTKGRQRLNTQATAFILLAIRDYLLVRESVKPDMHVDVQMLINQGGKRSQTTLSTHDIKGFDAPLISVKRKFDLYDSTLDTQAQKMITTEGIGISASGQGRLYYGARITQYPQTVRQESINRGYGLEREYRLKLPAETSDAQRRKLFRSNQDDASPDLFPKTLSYQLGDLLEVTLTLLVPHEAHYLVINDALPSGLEIVDQSLKGAQFSGPAKDSDWHAFNHIELKDDRVLLFADRLQQGTYKFRYIARASTVGRFIRPAAVVEEMYAPQHAGRSDGGYLWIGSAP